MILTATSVRSRDSTSAVDRRANDFSTVFVTWDPEIIPVQIAQAAAYPGVKERISFSKITDNDRAEFFAKYTNASLGRVKNLYLKWARLKGPMSAECQQLNRLFSQCVDGNRIKVPTSLEDPPEPARDAAPFILDVLHGDATTIIRNVVDREANTEGYGDDTIDLLLSRDRFAFSEFDLVQLVLQRCDRNSLSFADYTAYFNFSSLSDEQRAWLLGRLPAIKDMPSLVRNGLLQSDLVTPLELKRFGLDDHRLHFKPVFNSSSDRMARFLGAASRAMELFHKKLIIMRVNERLTVMVYIPSKVEKASEAHVGASVRVFALPRSAGSKPANYRVMPTKVNYRLYSDDGAFQLYDGKRGNTFVFLRRGAMDRTSFAHIENQIERRKAIQASLDSGINFDCRASIALDKISEPIRQHVGQIRSAGVLEAVSRCELFGCRAVWLTSNRRSTPSVTGT